MKLTGLSSSLRQVGGAPQKSPLSTKSAPAGLQECVLRDRATEGLSGVETQLEGGVEGEADCPARSLQCLRPARAGEGSGPGSRMLPVAGHSDTHHVQALGSSGDWAAQRPRGIHPNAAE